MAVTTRSKRQDAPEFAELTEIKAALQTVARITANVAARSANGPWRDFAKLLRDQYSATPADVELFMDILAGRKP